MRNLHGHLATFQAGLLLTGLLGSNSNSFLEKNWDQSIITICDIWEIRVRVKLP